MKTIPDYPNYKISEDGQIWSNKTNKYLKPGKNKGYLYVGLTNSDGFKCKKIHRLVAEAYLSNPLNLPVVMHLDNDKFNNSVSNLKWGTQVENNQQAWADGLKEKTRSACSKVGKLGRKKVICLNDSKVFESIKSAAEYYKLHKQLISLVCSGRYKSTGGKSFKLL